MLASALKSLSPSGTEVRRASVRSIDLDHAALDAAQLQRHEVDVPLAVEVGGKQQAAGTWLQAQAAVLVGEVERHQQLLVACLPDEHVALVRQAGPDQGPVGTG